MVTKRLKKVTSAYAMNFIFAHQSLIQYILIYKYFQKYSTIPW